jgi:hypothetical protein
MAITNRIHLDECIRLVYVYQVNKYIMRTPENEESDRPQVQPNAMMLPEGLD